MSKYILAAVILFLVTVFCSSLVAKSGDKFRYPKISYDKNGFKLDGEYRFLRGGTIQWFRIDESQWEDRLIKFKAAGFNTIDMYLPWNLVEETEGYINLYKHHMFRFLDLAKKHELFVYFRPGPYIANEMDAGGIPSWLLKRSTKLSIKKDGLINLRDNDPDFLELVERYFHAVNSAIKPYLASNGGPIILYAIENEYDHYIDIAKLEKLFRYDGGVERPFFYKPDTFGYFTSLRDIVIADGIDIPITTCPGRNLRGTGSVPGIIPMPNLYQGSEISKNVFDDLADMHNPNKFNGVYNEFPSGITEADRTPSRMKRVFMGGMDAFFAFDVSGMTTPGYYNSIAFFDINPFKLINAETYSEFTEVGYLTGNIDFHSPISASGALREKFYGFRRANQFFNSFEKDLAPILHARRTSRRPKIKNFVTVNNKEIGEQVGSSNRKRHYWLNAQNGAYFVQLLNEGKDLIEIEKNSIKIGVTTFPRFKKMVLAPEPAGGAYYTDWPDDVRNSQILVYKYPITEEVKLHYTTSDVLSLTDFNGDKLLIVYGVKGSNGEMKLDVSSSYKLLNSSENVTVEEKRDESITLSYGYSDFEFFTLESKSKKRLKVLILNRHLAGRVWNYKNMLVIGPEFLHNSPDGLILEFSDVYKNREVTVLSQYKTEIDGMQRSSKSGSKFGLSTFIHTEDFEFSGFLGKINSGKTISDVDEIEIDYFEDDGVRWEGPVRSFEELDIMRGHAWYRTDFYLPKEKYESAHLRVDHASDFVAIYVNGHYISTVSPLGTEIETDHKSPDYKLPDFGKYLKKGKNVIAFRVESWGHGAFGFPSGKLFGNFAQIPSIGLDSFKGLFGSAKLKIKFSTISKVTTIPLERWYASEGMHGENYGYTGDCFTDDEYWDYSSTPIDLKAGDILWYRVWFSRDDLPKLDNANAPMVFELKGKNAKATVYLNGKLIGRWLSDNKWLSRGVWLKPKRDLMSRVNPDHVPFAMESLKEKNVLAIAFEDVSAPHLNEYGRIESLKIVYNQERFGDSTASGLESHMLRSIKVPVIIRALEE
jgi:hypothetical protein